MFSDVLSRSYPLRSSTLCNFVCVIYNMHAVFVSHSTDGDEDPYLFIQLFAVQVEDYIERNKIV